MVYESKNIKQKVQNQGGGGRRKIRSCVLFTPAEYFIVKQNALKAGIKISGFLREMVMSGKIMSRLNEEERFFIRQLIGMADNLNQLRKTGQEEGLLAAASLFEKYRNQIDELLEKLEEND